MTGTHVDGLHARFLRGLSLFPENVAVRTDREEITYLQLHERALRWGGGLAKTFKDSSAVSPRVGVLASKSITAYVGILAALYAGATVVPLRPDFPSSRTQQQLDAAAVTALVADDAGLAVLPEVLSDRRDIPVLAPGATALPVPSITPTDRDTLHETARPRSGAPAYLLFTSGSTGRPKGVLITHGGLEHYFRLLDTRYDFVPDDVFSQAFDLNFDCALFDLFCAWGAGGTAVAIPPHAYRQLPHFLASQRMTVWFSTPHVIGLARRIGSLTEGAIPGLRWSLFAGEALKCQDVADWRRAAPDAALENLYGPTELTVTITAHRWSDEHSPREAVNGIAPIGAVHAEHEHMLLDEYGKPTDTEGELWVSGPQLAAGYLDPKDEEGRFVHRDGRRWYSTGDRVRRLTGGALVYLGRRDSQIQVQGWRIEPAELEHALRDSGAEDAAIVSVAVRDRSELFAFYTGEPMTTVEFTRRLRALLPESVTPRHYHHMQEFPRNANGKTDRLQLSNLAAELVAEQDR